MESSKSIIRSSKGVVSGVGAGRASRSAGFIHEGFRHGSRQIARPAPPILVQGDLRQVECRLNGQRVGEGAGLAHRFRAAGTLLNEQVRRGEGRAAALGQPERLVAPYGVAGGGEQSGIGGDHAEARRGGCSRAGGRIGHALLAGLEQLGAAGLPELGGFRFRGCCSLAALAASVVWKPSEFRRKYSRETSASKPRFPLLPMPQSVFQSAASWGV